VRHEARCAHSYVSRITIMRSINLRASIDNEI